MADLRDFTSACNCLLCTLANKASKKWSEGPAVITHHDARKEEDISKQHSFTFTEHYQNPKFNLEKLYFLPKKIHS